VCGIVYPALNFVILHYSFRRPVECVDFTIILGLFLVFIVKKRCDWNCCA